MKKKISYIILLFLIISFFSYIGISIFQNKKLLSVNEKQTESKTERKYLDKFITSYEECMDIGNDEESNYLIWIQKTRCTAYYRNLDDINAYNECKENSGNIRCPEIGTSFPIEDCSKKERTCTMAYYNPNIQFPDSYEECLPGDHNAIYYQLKECYLSIPKELDGVYNKDVAKRWYDECINITDEKMPVYYCDYHTLLPNESRKEYIKNECMKEEVREPNPGNTWSLMCNWAMN